MVDVSLRFLYRDVFFSAAAAATPLKTLKKRLETIGYPGSTGGSDHAVAAAVGVVAQSDNHQPVSRMVFVASCKSICP